MKPQIYIITIVLLSIASCQNFGSSSNTNLPLINSVQQLHNQEASSVPFLDETYMVRGRVVGRLFLFGKGCLRIADLNNPKVVINVLSDNSRSIGDVVTMKVVKKDLLQINEDEVEVYVEE